MRIKRRIIMAIIMRIII